MVTTHLVKLELDNFMDQVSMKDFALCHKKPFEF